MANEPFDINNLEEAKRLYQEIIELEYQVSGKYRTQLSDKQLLEEFKTFPGQIKRLNRELFLTENSFSNLYDRLRNIADEFKEQNTTIKKIRGSFRKLESIAQDLKFDEEEINKLNKKQLISLKDKIKYNSAILNQEAKSLINSKSILKSLNDEINQLKEQGKTFDEINDIISEKLKEDKYKNISDELKSSLQYYWDQGDLLDRISSKLDQRILGEKEILNLMGTSTALVVGMEKIFSKLGLGGLSNILNLEGAIEKAKKRAEELSTKKLREDLETSTALIENLTNQIKDMPGPSIVDEGIKGLKEELDKLQEDKNPPTDETKSRIEYLKGEIEKLENTKIGILIELTLDDEAFKNLPKEQQELITQLQEEKKHRENINLEIKKSESWLSKVINKSKVLGSLFSGLIGGINEAFSDPTVLMGAVLDQVLEGFIKINKQSVEFQRLSGYPIKDFDALNSSITSISDNLQSVVELSKQFGINASLAFSAIDIREVSEMTELMGISAEHAGHLALLSKKSHINLRDYNKTIIKTTNDFIKTNKVAVSHGQILEDVASVSSAISLSLGSQPDKIAEAALEARKLGLTLKEVDNIASSLLDFESSISSQLEAELLTGKQLNLETARYYALNNDLAGVSREIAKNQEILGVFAHGNRIQQEAIAKSMGLSREEMAQMVYKANLVNGLSEEQAALASSVNYEDMKRLEIQESIAASIEKISQALAGPLELVAQILDNTKMLSLILTTIATVTLVKLASSLLPWLSGLRKGISLGLVNLGITKKQAIASATKAGAEAAASTAKIPFVGAALAGAAFLSLYLLIKNSLKEANDLISPGYGKRVLSAPEGTYALNDRDTIVAGTDLLGNDRNIQEKAEPITSPDITNNISINLDPLLNKVQIIIDILKQGINLPEIKVEIPEISIPELNISLDPIISKLQEVIEAVKVSNKEISLEPIIKEIKEVSKNTKLLATIEMVKTFNPLLAFNPILFTTALAKGVKEETPELKLPTPEIQIDFNPLLDLISKEINILKNILNKEVKLDIPKLELPETSIVNNIQVEVPKIEVPNIILPELNIPIPEITFTPTINVPELNIDLSSVVNKIQEIIGILNTGFANLMSKNLDQQIIIPEQKPIINITNDFNPVIDKLSESNIFKPNIILPENIIEYPKFDFNVEPIINKLQEGISIIEQILSREIQSEVINPQVNNIENTTIQQPTTNVISTIGPSIDFNPIVSSINELKKENTEMKEILKQLLNKDSNVYLDGNKIGISLTTGTSNYSIQ